MSTRLFEWDALSYAKLNDAGLSPDSLNHFKTYLNEVWESRNWYREEAEDLKSGEEDATNANQQRFFSFGLNELKTRNYVGVVQYQGTRLEVYPKIFKDSYPKNFKSYFQNLFYWLSYCRKVNFPVSKSALDDLPADDFLEALVYLFAHYSEEVLTEQPFQTFEEVLEETPFLRGRLAMPEYTKLNIITGRWQYFQSAYEPLKYDNLFNRIVKYTSRILAEVSRNARNKSKLQDIQFLLDEVSDCVCTATDCDKVKLNPLYSNLADILQLCRLFLANLTISNDQPSESNFCFMLPMECVFEDFIFTFIQEHFPELHAKEQTGSFLAQRDKKSVFKIKNDILIEKRKLIIDTKYKIRHDADDGKAGVNQSDLYQMLAYAVKRGYHDVILLYPDVPGSVTADAKFTIASPFTVKPLQVTALNVSINKNEIKELESHLVEQFKAILSNV